MSQSSAQLPITQRRPNRRNRSTTEILSLERQIASLTASLQTIRARNKGLDFESDEECDNNTLEPWKDRRPTTASLPQLGSVPGVDNPELPSRINNGTEKIREISNGLDMGDLIAELTRATQADSLQH